MALLGNYSLASKSPGRFFGGNSTAHASGIGQFSPQLPGNWSRSGARRNFALQEGQATANEIAAIPDGYGGTAYVMPITSTRISSHNAAQGVAAFTANLAEGRNLSATFSGAATFAGTGQLVVSGSRAFAGVAAFSGNVIAALAAKSKRLPHEVEWSEGAKKLAEMGQRV